MAKVSTCASSLRLFVNPPMAVGGWLRFSLHKRPVSFSNPPNGGWGMVKVQP